MQYLLKTGTDVVNQTCGTRMPKLRHSWRAFCFVGVLSVLSLNTPASAQTKVPVLELSKPDAISSAHFGLILNVIPLANGKLLVNDGGPRQLIVLDAYRCGETRS
ncbi:MAG: hypothetical protein ABJB66_06860 [Gemmatimonadaceae bacterium]